MLFDPIERTDSRLPFHSEPCFAYLNQSARPEAARVRDLLERWLAQCPIAEQSRLVSEFRTGDDRKYYSCSFELFLHAFLTEVGGKPVFHPEIATGQVRRPDFLSAGDGGDAFLEATVATGRSTQDWGAAAREGNVYNALEKLDSPNFFVGTYVRCAPEKPLRAAKIRPRLQHWLSSLNVDEVSARVTREGLRGAPTMRCNIDGWEVKFTAQPKSPERRGKTGIRAIGFQGFGMTVVTGDRDVRSAVEEKATRYGELGRPYVIAVHVLDWPLPLYQLVAALYGTARYPASEEDEILSIDRALRKDDGAWYDAGGPRFTRVSAVLVAVHLEPWHLASARTWLFHNPYARFEYRGPLCRLPQVRAVGSRLKWSDGEAARDILQIPAAWPMNVAAG